MSELINLNKMSKEEIMKAIGQDSGSDNENIVPRLTINRNPEDDNGNQLPIGNFTVYDTRENKNYYGKTVTLRPFISGMQYMHYDPEKSEYVNRSVIFSSWKEEAIDIQGGTKCSKVPYKERDRLTAEELAVQKQIRCYRLVYGLVSFDGVDAEGNKKKVNNFPAVWRVTGTSFKPVSDAIDALKKRKKLMFTCTFKLDSKRQKKGSNVFYVPVITPNADANLEMSKEDMETLQVFKDSISAENHEVATLWKSAKDKKYSSEDTKSAKLVEELDDDLPDPAEILSA
jgi:hypothetical protein